MEALDGGLLDGPVHPLDLTVGPWVLGLGGAMLNVIRGAGVFEGMSPEALAVGDRLLDQRHGRPSGAGRGELDAVVGEHGVDLVGDGCDQPQQEVSRDGGGGLLVQFDEGELRSAVDGDEHVQLALFGPHLGDIDVEVTDRIAFELLLRRLVTFDSRLMPWRCRQRCNDERVRCGIVGCKA